MRDSGISRSDLWAYAGLVAVQSGIEHSNSNCNRQKGDKGLCPGDINEKAKCKYTTIPELPFRYGRVDCKKKCKDLDGKHGFCDPAKETHPNPHGNGKATTDFYKEEFGLTKKEVVALMGAHTLGAADIFNSGFNGVWVSNEAV